MKKTKPGFAALSRLTDDQLIQRCDRAVRHEQKSTLEILDCLLMIERRSLHPRGGYSSLFDYCIRRWRYSPSKAGRYIAAARCMVRFATVRDLLEQRKLSVCAVARLAGILTEKNSEQLLRQVSELQYREIENIVMTHRVAPIVRETVRPIGERKIAEHGAGKRETLFQVRRDQRGDSGESSRRVPRTTRSGAETGEAREEEGTR